MKTSAKILIFILLFLLSLGIAKGNPVYTKADSLIYEDYVKQTKSYRAEPLNNIVIRTAKYFLGKPYVISTLEIGTGERLVINLREFDCTTFVESCIALSLDLKSNRQSFSNFCNTLQNIRYRNGIVDGYASRLHYTSDWAYENQRQNILKDIGLDLGGEKMNKTMNFMTSHPQSYPKLKGNTVEIQKIRIVENEINSRNLYTIVKKSKIQDLKNAFSDGDIIIFGTSIIGLDYTHIGIAYHNGDRLGFIHASSRGKKVIVEPQSLSRYCLQSKNCTGISVLRLTELTTK